MGKSTNIIVITKFYRKISFVLFLLCISISGAFVIWGVNRDVEHGTMPYYVVQADGVKTTKASKDAMKVYLTFDDGPSKYTSEILEILKEHDIKATFFVVGDTGYDDCMKDIVAAGHTIGLHSYSHKFREIYKSSDAFFKDLQKIDDLVFEQTGIRSKVMRFPGGSSVNVNRAKMRRLCSEVISKGYQYFDWNSETDDTVGTTTVYRALSCIKKSAELAKDDDLIVLMHDTRRVTAKALPEIIEYFKEQGVEFKALSPSTPAIHHIK